MAQHLFSFRKRKSASAEHTLSHRYADASSAAALRPGPTNPAKKGLSPAQFVLLIEHPAKAGRDAVQRVIIKIAYAAANVKVLRANRIKCLLLLKFQYAIAVLLVTSEFHKMKAAFSF